MSTHKSKGMRITHPRLGLVLPMQNDPIPILPSTFHPHRPARIISLHQLSDNELVICKFSFENLSSREHIQIRCSKQTQPVFNILHPLQQERVLCHRQSEDTQSMDHTVTKAHSHQQLWNHAIASQSGWTNKYNTQRLYIAQSIHRSKVPYNK